MQIALRPVAVRALLLIAGVVLGLVAFLAVFAATTSSRHRLRDRRRRLDRHRPRRPPGTERLAAYVGRGFAESFAGVLVLTDPDLAI